MKKETKMLANKYSYVLDVITIDRYSLLKNLSLLDNEEDNDYNTEIFFDFRLSIYKFKSPYIFCLDIKFYE